MEYNKLYNIIYEPKIIVEDAIDKILDQGAGILYMKYVLAKIPQFLGELYSGVSDYVIDEVSLTYDRGDTQKEIQRFWPEDAEPEAAQIDNWARFRIVTEIKKAPEEPELDNLMENTSNVMKDSNLINKNMSFGVMKNSSMALKGPSMALGKSGANVIKNGSSVSTRSMEGSAVKKNGSMVSVNKNKLGKQLTVKKFIGDDELSDWCPELKELSSDEDKVEEIVDPVEERLRKDREDKIKKVEAENVIIKKKQFEEQEKDKQRKEFVKNLAKKNYTYDFNGDYIILKPLKADSLMQNDQTEIHYNLKKKPESVGPGYNIEEYKEADVIEKEGGPIKSLFAKPQDYQKFSRQSIDMNPKELKGQPVLQDYMEMAKGVTIKLAKGQQKTGGPVVLKNRMRIGDWNAVSKIAKKKKEQRKVTEKMSDGFENMAQVKKQKDEVKQQKYKKTVENWKSELDKGQHSKDIRFNPDLLIKLVMTDDDMLYAMDPVTLQNYLEKKGERLEKAKQLNLIKQKMDQVMKDPERFFNRIIAYDPKKLGLNVKPTRTNEMFNEFQKGLNDFNKKIIEAQEENWGDNLDHVSKDTEETAPKPVIKPDKLESMVRSRKIMGNLNKMTYNHDTAGGIIQRNSSAVNLQSTFNYAADFHRTKPLDKVGDNAKSQMLKTRGSRDFNIKRVSTLKPDSKNLITKEEHDQNLKKNEIIKTNKSSSHHKSSSKGSRIIQSKASINTGS